MPPGARLRLVRRLALGIALLAVATPGTGLSGVPGAGTAAEAARLRPSGHPQATTTLPTMPVLPAPAVWPEPTVVPSDAAVGTAPTPASGPDPALAPAPVEPPTVPSPPKGPTPTPAVVAHLPAAGIPVYAGPADPTPILTLSGRTEFDNPRVLLTTGLAAPGPGGAGRPEERIEVHLPTRPNGTTGWIPRGDVSLAEVPDRITVDLRARSVTWTRGAEMLGQVVAAVGVPGTPTPPGTYFVTDVLPYSAVGATSPAGEYGPWVVALDGYSEAFTTFRGGEPRLAIHGTNVPTSLGTASSAGCIRIGTSPLSALAAGVPLGTPVVIVP